MKFDLAAMATASLLINPAVLTADTNSASADRAGYSGVDFTVLVGESGDTLSGSVKIELEVQESDDDSTFTAAADADITGAVTGTNTGTFAVIDAAADDDAVHVCKYIGSKRYSRVVVNVTGTHSNGTPIGAVAFLSGATQQP